MLRHTSLIFSWVSIGKSSLSFKIGKTFDNGLLKKSLQAVIYRREDNQNRYMPHMELRP